MSDAPGPAALRIIRMSLIFGVLAFGGIAYVTKEQRQVTLDAETAGMLRLVVYALAIGVVIASVVFRRLRHRAADERAAAGTTIVAWAIGETPAVVGAVVYFMTGNPEPFLVGVAAFAVMLLSVRI